MSCSRSSCASSGVSAAGWKYPTCRAWSCGGRWARPLASILRKSPRKTRHLISPRSYAARGSPRSRRSTEMEPRSETAMLWDGLKHNLLAGTRLALFLPVRALDFRISVGQYVALVFASFAFWLVGGMLRAGFPGTVDFGALTAGLAEIPLVLGTCLLAARVFREAQLAVAFAVVLVATDPVFEVAGVAVQVAAHLEAVELDADAVYWAFVAWGFAVLPRALYVLTGWRGRPSVLALGLFVGLLAIIVAVFPRSELWIAVRNDRAEAARPPLELAQLTPSALARMLADSGIKWKVIVISACFSGGYIEPLKDDNTLIITSADAFHSSFGCDYESDYTWFSQAFYDEALRDTFSFAEAFEAAKETVDDRERAEGYPPSNPQMFEGAAMKKKLAALEKRLAAREAEPVQRSRASSVRASESTIVVAKGR